MMLTGDVIVPGLLEHQLCLPDPAIRSLPDSPSRATEMLCPHTPLSTDSTAPAHRTAETHPRYLLHEELITHLQRPPEAPLLHLQFLLTMLQMF